MSIWRISWIPYLLCLWRNFSTDSKNMIVLMISILSKTATDKCGYYGCFYHQHFWIFTVVITIHFASKDFHKVKYCLMCFIQILISFWEHLFWLLLVLWQVDRGCFLLLDIWSHFWYIQGSVFVGMLTLPRHLIPTVVYPGVHVCRDAYSS
jgi:hypothetical protein